MKSSIFFSKNTDDRVKHNICTILGMSEANEQSTYLGLPNTMGRNKNAILGFLKEKMQRRIEGWDSKLLSRAGKEVLIKTVAQSLPNYAISVFLLNKGMCEEMESMMCSFWWRTSNKSTKGIHWMSWDRMCVPKDRGGLGFRKLRDFNIALLGKQGWRLMSNPQSLVGRIFKSRYFPRGSFLDAELGSNPSFIWRSLMEAQSLVKEGCRIALGSGMGTSIMKDPWLLDMSYPYITTVNQAIVDRTVDSLMVMGERRWDVDLVLDIFNKRDADLIRSMPLFSSVGYDKLQWCFEKDGEYSVSSAYNHIQDKKFLNVAVGEIQFWKRFWKTKVPPKALNLVWRAVTNCLPTRIQLITKHVHVQRSYPRLSVCKMVFSIGAKNKPYILTGLWRQLLHGTMLNINRQLCCAGLYGKLGMIKFGKGGELWMKSIGNTIKINVDASIFEDQNRYGFGWVARNNEGRLLWAKNGSRWGKVSAEFVEAMGLKEVLSWLKERNLSNVVVESDSLVTIQAIRSSISFCSSFGFCISECQRLISSLSNVDVCFVKRSANRVAHHLARASDSLADCTYRESTIPATIMDVIHRDI
uniref:RNase H type-1 domain-containing protein n=1 Tax=Cannabis sativa TaxID=3483 RepID=A0A803NG08_CANSA